MTKQTKIFTALTAVTAVLLLLLLAVVLPIFFSDSAADTPPVETEPGESAVGQTLLLFDAVGRTEIKEIAVYNKDGSYAFVRPPSDPDDENSFCLKVGDKVYENLPVKEGSATGDLTDIAPMTQLAVYAGTPHVRERLTGSADKPLRFTDYGLADSQSPAYYVLTYYTDDERTETAQHKVYIGKKTADGNGYYIRLDGRNDKLYVTQMSTLGDLILSPAADYLEATLFPTVDSEATYRFAQEFTWLSEKRDYGKNADGTLSYRVLSVSDTYAAVRIREVTEIDGVITSVVEKTEVYHLRLSDNSHVASRLVGQTVGAPLSVAPYVAEDRDIENDKGGVSRRVRTVYYEELLYAAERETNVSFDLVKDAEYRDYLYGGHLYELTPGFETAKGYALDDFYIMNLLATLGAATGDKVVAVGISDELIEKYGLYKNKVTYNMPVKSSTQEVTPDKAYGAAATTVLINDEDYREICLYISDRQKDGTYYVYSSYTDVVAVAGEEAFSFVEDSLDAFLSDSLIEVYYGMFQEITYEFFYQDFKGAYRFDLDSYYQNENGRDENGNTVTVETLQLNGSTVSFQNFTEAYRYLLLQQYIGETGLSKEATDTLLSGEPILRITLLSRDGRTLTYAFYPYSERRLAVSVREGEKEGSALLSVSASAVKTLADAFRLYTENGTDIYLRRD